MPKTPKKRIQEAVSMGRLETANAVADPLGVAGSIPAALSQEMRLLREMDELSKKILSAPYSVSGAYLGKQNYSDEFYRKAIEYSLLTKEQENATSFDFEQYIKSRYTDITSKNDSKSSPDGEISQISSIDERLANLETFAKLRKGEGVADFARNLFPELGNAGQDLAGKSFIRAADSPNDEVIALPLEAPKRWSYDREGNETPPEFIVRIYSAWMGKGLTMADIRRLDEPLAQSLYHHIRKSRPMPEGFDLPTKHEQRNRVESTIGEEADISRREYLRTKQARYRQNKRGGGSDTPAR